MMPQMARHLLDSTAFGLIVALIVRLMPKRGAAARHTVWLIAAAKFAVPAALFSLAGAHLRTFFPAHRLVFVAPVVFTNLVALPDVPASSMAPVVLARILIPSLWLGGTVAMLAVWIRRLLMPVGTFTPVPESDKQALLRLGRRMDVRRAVRLRYSKVKVEPSLAGTWRPTITISQGLREQLTPAEFEVVLLHELAHAKRADNLSTALVHALACVFWFHPLLWWIERQLLRERELACDELVVRHGSTPEDYVNGILKVCRFHLSGAAEAACGIAGSDLKKRLEAIMSFRPSSPAPCAPKFLVGALASLITIVPLASGFLSGANVMGQKESSSNPSSGVERSKRVNCKYRDISFPEGALIYVTGMKGTQMCVARGPHGVHWDWSEDPKRRSDPAVVVLPPEKPLPPCVIRPARSQDKCACQTGLFSSGSLVDSAEGKGKLYCDKGQWRPATRREQGLE
jgi:beta-lactamase regulating signal transducer with metallopeptidase domain